MRRGFVFSMDAAAAIVLVIVLAGAVAAYHFSSGSEERIFGSMREKAGDRASVAFYTTDLKSNPVNESISDNAEFGKCVRVYVLDPAKDPANRSALNQNDFCEEI